MVLASAVRSHVLRDRPLLLCDPARGLLGLEPQQHFEPVLVRSQRLWVTREQEELGGQRLGPPGWALAEEEDPDLVSLPASTHQPIHPVRGVGQVVLAKSLW